MFALRSLAGVSIVCASLASPGCASGPSQGTDAGHERPPRPDTGIGADDGGGSPDASGTPDAGSMDGGSPIDAGASLDAGASPDAGPAPDAGTSTDAAASVDSPATDAFTRCCATTADCGGFGVCVIPMAGGSGTCERALTGGRGDCWTDADCSGSQTCGGVRMTECTNVRGFIDDSPGRCR